MPQPPRIGHALDDAVHLRLTDVSCRRGDRMLWRGISLTLNAGEAVQVAGPNGSGKSSLLRIAAGLLPPDSGAVERTCDTALADENAALDRELPLGAALQFWLRIYEQSGNAQSTAGALAKVGLASMADVPVRLLSTGQRKRATLARILCANAPLWLLDEPANGLDSAGLEMLSALIAAHRDGGGTVLFASHQHLPVADATLLTLDDYRC